MSRKTLVVTLWAAAALLGGNGWAGSTAPEHGHEAGVAALQLDNGKKWSTDAPLRTGMENIRAALSRSLDAIHRDRLSSADYDKLAATIEREVAGIVTNCKLEPEADAQLHLVVAQLGAATDSMKAGSAAERRRGAVRVVQTLDAYAGHFDHPGWKRIEH